MDLFTLLIGAIGGTLIGGLFQFIINERKAKNERELNLQAQKYQDKKKQEEDRDNRLKEEARTKGKLIKLAYNLNIEFSLTKNYILETKETKEQEIHDSYLKQYDQIADALSDCLIYFPDTKVYFHEIANLANLIWGLRQNYFGHSKDNEVSKNQLRIELIGHFNKIPGLVNSIEDSLFND